jgi:hypothetical protein
MDTILAIRERVANLLRDLDQLIQQFEIAAQTAEEERTNCRRRLYPIGCPSSRADEKHGDDDGQVEPPA